MNSLSELGSLVGLSEPVSPPESLSLKRADGGHLHAQRWSKAGPPVLLLHGGGQSSQTWTLCAMLLKDDYQCVALDLRGHGDSDWADDYSIQAHVEDIGRAMTQLGWSGAHLVGMSLGGVVAAHYALSNGKPATRSLALVDVAPGVSFSDISKLREFMGADTVTQGVDALVAEARRLGAHQSDAELHYRYASLTLRTKSGAWRWKRDERKPVDYAHILNHIELLREKASSFDCPCLIARGGRSRILSDKAATEFADLCTRASVVTIERAGHSVQEDNPIRLTHELRRFWKELDE
ncbi:MAG: alpha/beta hydrolase [Parasphingorhabdus sp.]